MVSQYIGETFKDLNNMNFSVNSQATMGVFPLVSAA